MTSHLVVDGVDVHVEGQGPDTIVMVHGWPDTYRLWDGQVAALKGRYRCVRFTLPGFDRAHPRRTRTLDELTGFIKQVVEKVAPGRKVILMLHDWGCVFGYEFYMRHSKLVSRIIGVDIGDARSMQRSAGLHVLLMVLAYQLTLALAWIFGGAFGDRLTRGVARGMRCPSDTAAMGAHMTYPYFMTWFGGKNSYRRHLQAFTPACPMLYAYAKRKPFMFHAKDWLDDLQKRDYNRVVGFDCGHWVMVDQRERFNQAVTEWLAAGISAAA